MNFTRLGFILSLAGSAIGLGNIWKFPYVAGENGGGVFIVIFILSVAFVLFSAFMAEIVLGRESNKNPVLAFYTLAPKNKRLWSCGGAMILSALIILSFYSMVLGWILYYTIYVLFAIPLDGKEASELFGFLSTNTPYQIATHAVIIVFCAFVLSFGIKRGIERLNVILVPVLFIIFALLFIYALNLESFGEAFVFMFDWRIEHVTSKTILEALGQAFFSMSLGVGTVMAYAASMPRNTNFITSSVLIAALNTLLALLAGLVVFSLLFEYDLPPSGGPGLVFISLPTVFAKLGILGHLLAFLFFIALLFAGVTSAVSMAEPSIAYLIQSWNLERKKATIIVMTFCFSLGALTIIAGNESAAYLGGWSLFDWLDKLTTTVFMPLGGIFACLFVGFVIPKNESFAMFDGYLTRPVFQLWLVLVRFIAPIIIGIIMLQSFCANFFNLDIVALITHKLGQ